MLAHPDATSYFRGLSCFTCSDLLRVERAAGLYFHLSWEKCLHIIVLSSPLQNALPNPAPGVSRPLSAPFQPSPVSELQKRGRNKVDNVFTLVYFGLREEENASRR
jgi:hypothetical protein